MLIHFSKRFPDASKPQVRVLIERAAKAWGFEEWEIEINLRCPRASLAEVVPVPESHRAIVSLNPARLDSSLLARDLLHELLHIPRWPVDEALCLLLEAIPSGKRRAAKRRAELLLELDHDAETLRWIKILQPS